MALRVLGAPDEEAAAWGGIAGALQPPAAAQADAGGAAASSSGGGSGSGSGSEDEDEDGPHLGAVQVWPVLDADGQPLAAGATSSADERQRLLQQGHAALLSRGMCELLQGAVQRRLAQYAASLDADLAELAELERRQQGAGAAPAPAASQAAAEEADARVAHRAALLLRITEKEVLNALQTALERRLAALPPAEPKGSSKGKRKAAAAAPAGKQQQQQTKQQKRGGGGGKARRK